MRCWRKWRSGRSAQRIRESAKWTSKQNIDLRKIIPMSNDEWRVLVNASHILCIYVTWSVASKREFNGLANARTPTTCYCRRCAQFSFSILELLATCTISVHINPSVSVCTMRWNGRMVERARRTALHAQQKSQHTGVLDIVLYLIITQEKRFQCLLIVPENRFCARREWALSPNENSGEYRRLWLITWHVAI